MLRYIYDFNLMLNLVDYNRFDNSLSFISARLISKINFRNLVGLTLVKMRHEALGAASNHLDVNNTCNSKYT